MQPTLPSSEVKSPIQQATDEKKLSQADSKQPTPQSPQQTFIKVHKATNTTPYPNSSQADQERTGNNTHQKSMQGINDAADKIQKQRRDSPQSRKKCQGASQEEIEKKRALTQLSNEISDCTMSIQLANKNSQEKEVERLQEKLQDLQQRYDTLRRGDTSDQNVDSDSSVGQITETSESEDSSFSSEENTPLKVKEALSKLYEELSNWEDELKKKKTELVIKTRAKANKEDIEQFQKEIDSLHNDIEKLKQILQSPVKDTEHVPDTVEIDGTSPSRLPTQPDKSSVMGVIRRMKTGRRNHTATNTREDITNLSTTTSTPLKQLNESHNRNSALLSREELKTLFTNKAQKARQKIDEKIEAVGRSIDFLFEQRDAINKTILEKNISRDHSPEGKKLTKISNDIRNRVFELSRLFTRLTILEDWVSPGTEHFSAKQKHERYEAFLKKYKSEDTVRLEENYKKQRAEYERKVLGSWSTNAMSILAGGVTNFSTFFWGNSLTRLLAGKLSEAAGYIGGAVAGLLHVVVGGPVLKQVASASWNSPALTEFNDYWKVLGSLWGDRFRAYLGEFGVERWVGENHKEKYLSKDPGRIGLVDIEQRWKETPGLWPLFKDRYKTEEAAYYTYAMNFTSKAAVAGGLAQLMATKSDASRAIEWIVHSVMGWFSGAETVAGIQWARSRVPGATESAIPNREIHAAHAAMLESLLKNLEDAYGKLRAQAPSEAGDSEQRDLLKAIRRTQKSLHEAKTKSGFGGTFWFEFLAQFKTVDARADAAAEILGRALSVMPSAALSNCLASWRTSGNPVFTFAGHALPALLLIAPPGWTFRPLYAGFFRALFQMVINEASPKVNTSGHATTTTAVPDDLHDSIVDGSESSSYLGDEFAKSGEGDTKVEADESVIVTVSDREETSHDDDSDDEVWKGRPTARNQDNYWS